MVDVAYYFLKEYSNQHKHSLIKNCSPIDQIGHVCDWLGDSSCCGVRMHRYRMGLWLVDMIAKNDLYRANELTLILTNKGYKNFQKDITMMVGPKENHPFLYYYSSICWLYITPAILFAIVVVSMLKFDTLRIDDYRFPIWVELKRVQKCKMNCFLFCLRIF